MNDRPQTFTTAKQFTGFVILSVITFIAFCCYSYSEYSLLLKNGIITIAKIEEITEGQRSSHVNYKFRPVNSSSFFTGRAKVNPELGINSESNCYLVLYDSLNPANNYLFLEPFHGQFDYGYNFSKIFKKKKEELTFFKFFETD